MFKQIAFFFIYTTSDFIRNGKNSTNLNPVLNTIALLMQKKMEQMQNLGDILNLNMLYKTENDTVCLICASFLIHSDLF